MNPIEDGEDFCFRVDEQAPPVALRLKELETLRRVAERVDKISVFGGLDQVLNGLVKIR